MTREKEKILGADKVILPGVGSFGKHLPLAKGCPPERAHLRPALRPPLAIPVPQANSPPGAGCHPVLCFPAVPPVGFPPPGSRKKKPGRLSLTVMCYIRKDWNLW